MKTIKWQDYMPLNSLGLVNRLLQTEKIAKPHSDSNRQNRQNSLVGNAFF